MPKKKTKKEVKLTEKEINKLDKLTNEMTTKEIRVKTDDIVLVKKSQMREIDLSSEVFQDLFLKESSKLINKYERIESVINGVDPQLQSLVEIVTKRDGLRRGISLLESLYEDILLRSEHSKALFKRYELDEVIKEDTKIPDLKKETTKILNDYFDGGKDIKSTI